MAAGVQLTSGLLQTEDLDTLLDSKTGLEIGGEVRTTGLLGLLQKIDKTFRPIRQRSFRAVNREGFMVDLIRAPFTNRSLPVSLGGQGDLVAEPLQGLDWLAGAPRIAQIVIAGNGYPVRFIVPDPRFFALHKIWLSLQPSRDPMKRKRDFRQGEAVANLALDYLNLSFDDSVMSELPHELALMKTGLVERLRSRHPDNRGMIKLSMPPGFDDADE
jgi:hypothetical protein